MASVLAWPATQAAALCRAAAAAARAFAAARGPAPGPPRPDSATAAAPASRAAATSPATIITSRRGRPGRDRRVQLSRRRSHSRTVVTRTVPQDGSAAGRCPDGGGSAWPGCGSPASGWPGSGDGWGGRAGSGPSCHQSGRKSSGGRGWTYGAGRPGSPDGPGGVACTGGPSPRAGAGFLESRDGTDGRDGSACRLGSSAGMGGGGPGGSGGLGRSGGSWPGPAGRTTWTASAAAPSSPVPGGWGGFSLVSSLSCGCARTAPPPAVSPGGGGRPLRDCMLVSPGPHGARSCA